MMEIICYSKKPVYMEAFEKEERCYLDALSAMTPQQLKRQGYGVRR